MSHRFQVNLSGVISLLSNHLYSGPEVFARELLQNGVDAIRAREGLKLEGDAAWRGRIEMELERGGGKATLVFSDNGIGLTEEEIHRFLATIGESSKRDELGRARSDFIGQFGIGLLSAFLVADEIVMITRSAREGEAAKTMEWVGRPDGTYTVRELKGKLDFGTRVYLRCKAGMEEYFEAAELKELMLHYGGLLPYPILMGVAGAKKEINSGGIPWRRTYKSDFGRREAYLAFGQDLFATQFFDAFDIKSAAGDVQGIAFILPRAAAPNAKQQHRVYLKQMLLSEQADGLLPEWAFFVRVVVNANGLRPNAAREAFYEDKNLEAARTALGRCLADYLTEMAGAEPERLRRFIAIHQLAICALAVHDDGFFKLVADMLPFETSLGVMTLAEYRQGRSVVQYAPSVDQFRQVAGVAAAQDICIINAGHTYEEELLRRLEEIYPELSVEAVDAGKLAQSFGGLTGKELDESAFLERMASRALADFGCAAEVGKFKPEELATLYTTNRDGGFLRSAEQARDMNKGVWGEVSGGFAAGRTTPLARLMFNWENSLVRKLAAVKQEGVVRRAVEMLYVQALMLGRHPLSTREMTLLNDGVLAMVQGMVGGQS